MRANGLILGLFVAGVGALGGCGNGGGGTTGGTTDPCEALEDIANADSCEAQSSDPDCTLITKDQKYDACGVGLEKPGAALKRSANVKEFGGTGDPELSCFETASFPEKPGTSETVTIKGAAVIFSHGCESKNLTIEVYKVKRTGGDDDGALGELVGSAVTTPDDCSVDGVASEEEGCDPQRFECNFTYPNVPSETELVVKTSGADWASLYDYNLFIRNADVKAGVWTHDVRALAQDDYGVISQAAIGAPITAGHGAIAGEVHDCGDVRLQNAVVDINSPRKIVTYFGDDEAHPLPDLSGEATSTLGLYAAIDVDPGPAAIAAGGLDKSGKMVGIGFLRVRVFPDSVTAITFRGMNPILVP